MNSIELSKIIEIGNELTESLSSSDEEIKRNKSLLWTPKIEGTISGWMSNCVIFANSHKENSKYYKNIFYILGIPAAVLPVVLMSIGDYIEDYPTINIVLLVIMSILNVVLGFIDPGKLAESHSNFEALFNELSVEISSELIKPRQHRPDPDVFIQKIMDKYNSLNNRAPS